jgi:hypothetical protein
MKTRLLFIFTLLFFFNYTNGQEKTVSDKIKIERDVELGKLTSELNESDRVIDSLQLSLTSVKGNKKKVESLEKLQVALEGRLKKLEEKPKTEIRLNGQLAFTELLSVQRDIKPADLFLKSQLFFTNLGDIGNINKYTVYTNWKVEYDKWYERKKSNNTVATLITNSLNIVSDISNKVPLYGSISQTITSGLTSIIGELGNRDKALKTKSPEMIQLFNMIGQFEQQKSIIDHEWDLINKELKQLKEENLVLLKDQFEYYDLSYTDFIEEYMKETIDNKRDLFKEKCREGINRKVESFENKNNNTWQRDVETYMYKVQSIRLRFGQLTNRMLSNIDSYKNLIKIYNKPSYPAEFTHKVSNLSSSLNEVRTTFYDSFNPVDYIEDSATMYIGTQK